MLLFYVRHGDPIYNPDSLTPLGERQAEAVARRLTLFGLDEIYASSSNRAMLTAKPTCDILKKEMHILEWCHEGLAYRDLACKDESDKMQWIFRQKKYIQLFASDEIRNMGRKWYEHSAFADTTFAAGICRIQTEADAFLSTLGYEHDLKNNYYNVREENDKRIALFAHEGFGLAFLSCVLDIPYPIFSTHFDMTHSGMTVIEFTARDGVCVPRLLQFSNDSHIYKQDLPLNFQNRLRF